MNVDVAIVGGGPAGLNAALVLGRARRSVALFDNSQPRNGVTHASHGFLTRDGVTPAEFRRIAYEEVLRYPAVQHWPAEVTHVERAEHGFVLHSDTGEQVKAERVILAAGFKDVLPQIEGIREHYGKSLFVCPFCDGWELRDQPLVVISEQPSVFHQVKVLYNWGTDIVVCTNGHEEILDTDQREKLAGKGVRIVDTPVASVTGNEGKLEQVRFTDGTSIARSGGFIAPTLIPHIQFEESLGYETTSNGGIVTDELGRTTTPGIYAAGDSAYFMPSQLIYAAASGSKAAMAVMSDLIEQQWQ